MSCRIRHLFVASVACLALPVASAHAVGACDFTTARSSFSGTAVEQAQCLLRTVRKGGNVSSQPARLPEFLASHIGKPTDGMAARLASYLSRAGLAQDGLGGALTSPLSRGNNNSSASPAARYFVIHDTSSPNLGDVADFPADIDVSDRVNRLAGYGGANSKAHVFVNRRGETLTGHAFSVPWRATKLETRAVGRPAKGLFLHIELIQPRHSERGSAQSDIVAPVPGFSPKQYETLALLYTAASARAGSWLVPGFHAAIDEGLEDAHDDPQNFDLDRFSAAVETLQANLSAN